MPRLGAAYYGYLHQDAVIAYAFATLLLSESGSQTASVERRVVPNDRFDDLEIVGRLRRRVQIKSHRGNDRPLRIRDFITDDISFRIDNVVQSFAADMDPADEYRLFATYDMPDESLVPFLVPVPGIPALLPGIATQRFRLAPNRLWPEQMSPEWSPLGTVDREVFVHFCDHFVIEILCPKSSSDLRSPGPFEQRLLEYLAERVGLGQWPNNNRDVPDAAAHLIHAAAVARSSGATLNESDIIRILALRVDYGRVPEVLPVDQHRLIQRTDLVDDIMGLLHTNSRIAITGSPGIGKSWLLYQLAEQLIESGWIVATHYCFVDLLDSDRYRRASVDTTFGSLTAELLERDPSLASYKIPRFSAGARNLEMLLHDATREQPSRRIAIIVDGLDHADRLPDHPTARVAAEITEELASLSLPVGTVIIVGSQPGDHLRSFVEGAAEYRLPRWPNAPINALVARMRVRETLEENGIPADVVDVIGAITQKSDGSPLYATYLSKAVLRVIDDPFRQHVADITQYISEAPAFADDLNSYYEWLLRPIESEPGGLFIAQLLSLLDFSITSEELKQILPHYAHLVERTISTLLPVLLDDPMRGGLRVYHESFQRYVRERLLSTPDVNVSSILSPVIQWLDGRAFFADARAFRSLFRLLERAGRGAEIVERVSDNFVELAARNCQSGNPVRTNLSIAARAAAATQNWPVLVRLVELARAAESLYYWRFDDHTLAEAYGRAFAALFGANRLVSQLLDDGHCTFPPRPGLVLCRLCDEAGEVPPWSEYRSAHELAARNSNVQYPPDSRGALVEARIMGRLRIAGREEAISLCSEWLKHQDFPLNARDLGVILGRMYGGDTVECLLQKFENGAARGWLFLALSSLSSGAEKKLEHARHAVQAGLPSQGWLEALDYGVDSESIPRRRRDLDSLTSAVLDSAVEFEPDRFIDWFTEIRFSAKDPGRLMRAEGQIPSDSWFHRWLRYCITLVHPATSSDDLIEALRNLSTDIEVFAGKPRACDLFKLHDEIQLSFRRTLERLNESQWPKALEYLAAISRGTSTWLQGTRTGPLRADILLELCLSAADTAAKKTAATAACSSLLAPESRSNEYYDTHAIDQLLLVRLYAASGNRESCEASWGEACTYLAGYGQRKDITIWELLDPLKTLAQSDRRRTRHCLRELQPLVERVLVHTDGKETSHAIHTWIDLAAEIHPAGALSYIARDQISNMPAFGDLDHALPKALIQLHEDGEAIPLAAAWMGIGGLARQACENALAQCEKAAGIDYSVGVRLWSAVAASLEGDAAEPHQGLAASIRISAERLGLAVPVLDPEIPRPPRNHMHVSDPVPHQNRSSTTVPVLPPRASPLQIAVAFRNWRASGESRPDRDRAVNAVGWRLIEMVQDGQELAAEELIKRLARDSSRWESLSILPDVAEGLARHGATRLAALAGTFSYTSAYDGWRQFAGAQGEGPFRMAVTLDDSIAWSTLADEVSEAVRAGGPNGVTAHVIELLARMGKSEQAFACWDAACSTITYRTPSTGERDRFSVRYEEDDEAAGEMLWTSMASRLNFVNHQEKRLAYAAIALAIRFSSQTLGSVIRLSATGPSPISSLTTLLQLLEEYEQEPYETTKAAAAELRSVASGSYCTARMLAYDLLERAGVPVDLPPPAALAPVLASPNEIGEFINYIGSTRIAPILELWPEFGRRAKTCFDLALQSEDLKNEMERSLRRLRRDRRDRHVGLWLPLDEEVERCLQVTGAGIRTALAEDGIVDPETEAFVAHNLIGAIDSGVRSCLSRTIRPSTLVRPAEAALGTTQTAPIVIASGEFRNWVVLAQIETEVIVGDEYERPVQTRFRLWSGLIFGNWQENSGLPLGRAYPDIWRSTGWRQVERPQSFAGPLAAFEMLRDPFGRLQMLAPHPVWIVLGDLDSAPMEDGLTFFDFHGEPALVSRNWSQRFIGDDFEDREPKLRGVALLARVDLYEKLVTRLGASPICITINESVTATSES